MLGTVVRWGESHGYGFIHADGDSGPDIYVHRSQLLNARYLRAGETVSFKLGEYNGHAGATHVYVERGKDDEVQ